MPVLADLWEPLNKWIDIYFPRFKDEGIPLPMGSEESGDIEALMTYLSSPQPFLDAATNLENEALFLRISEWLAHELFERQNHATGSEIPPSLAKLLECWHSSRCSIITLNYDTLIEAGLVTLTIGGPTRILPSDVYPVPIARIESRYASVLGGERRPTFELIKLHGSLNWYYSGDRSFAGEQIFDIGSIAPWSRSEPTDWSSIQERAAGLIPLVIPPTFAKSPFFNNTTVRELWTRASYRLAMPGKLIIVGYSVPPGDLQIRGLLDRTARVKEVIVVDTSPGVVDRVRNAIPGANVVDRLGSVGDFVDAYCS